MKLFAGIIFFIFGLSAFSQTTLGHETKPRPEKPATSSKKHKVLLIPFELKMYMSEIDHKINAETNWNQQKIKTTFREGVDDQLYKKLKQHFDVLSLLDDTIKYKKDLQKIYQYLSYKFEKVPNQENYTAPKPEKEKPAIKNGQIVAETRNDNRFMNAKITNPTLVPELFAKLKTDIFVFINQVDISSVVPTLNEPNIPLHRRIKLHYTVYTVNAKEINSGVAEADFPGDVNNPLKINNLYISLVAEQITKRIEKALSNSTQ